MVRIVGSNFGRSIDNDEIETATIGSDKMAFGLFELVARETVGTATTDVDFTGLDLESDQTYFVVWYLKNASGASILNASIYFNSDTNALNYYTQEALYVAAAVNAARANNAIMTSITANNSGMGYFWIKKVTGESARVDGQVVDRDGANVIGGAKMHNWTNTANVTSIKVRSNLANGIDAGSVIELYKVTM